MVGYTSQASFVIFLAMKRLTNKFKVALLKTHTKLGVNSIELDEHEFPHRRWYGTAP